MRCLLPQLQRRSAHRSQIHAQPMTLAVTDGASTVGFLIERDGSFFAFDQDGTLLGEYATRTQAARAIPRVRA
jgi:hypothetical protein